MRAIRHLRITGRTKDLFKTSKGKYVAPSPIESNVATCPQLEAVCVVGANLAYPLALAMPSPTAAGLSREQLKEAPIETLDRVNEKHGHTVWFRRGPGGDGTESRLCRGTW